MHRSPRPARLRPRTLPAALLAATVICGTVVAATGCAPSPLNQARLELDGDLELTVEIAETPEQQRTGLSGRASVEPGTGMLFPFDSAGPQRVWMAGMSFPIDIAWIRDGRVLATATLPVCTTPDPDDCPRWESPGDVDALLETTAGALDAIEPGALVRTTD
ncbi:DUF192 domain-containing protein [Microbacterium sp. NPDC078428]|uniref:DUF192 domain-containing protein n=1 Tax=Microbacterium sp. NPDC078428 TaxID=3364190 RepID=UPI0037CC611A